MTLHFIVMLFLIFTLPFDAWEHRVALNDEAIENLSEFKLPEEDLHDVLSYVSAYSS